MPHDCSAEQQPMTTYFKDNRDSVSTEYLRENFQALNPPAVLFGLEEAKAQLDDKIDAMSAINERVGLLVKTGIAFIAGSIFLTARSHHSIPAILQVGMMCAALLMVGCIVCCINAYRTGGHPSKGAHPRHTLSEDIITGNYDNAMLAKAYVLHMYGEKIDQADAANITKTQHMNKAFLCFGLSIASILLMQVVYVISRFF